MEKWAIGAAVVVVVGGGTRAAGLWGGSNGSSNALKFSFPTEIQTLDISKNTDTYSGTIIGNTGANLLRVNAKGKAVPELAKSVKVSKMVLTYTATLRSGLKWSDGSSLTAKDFVYSWQRIVDPKTASQYSYLASGVKNADAITAGKAKVSTLGVSAKGNVITFKLERPMPQFNYLLTFANFMPTKQSFVEKQGKKYGTTSAKATIFWSYKFEGWNGTNNSFKLVKNDNYWDAKSVKTKEIDYSVVKKPETAVQLYKQGKLDRASISTPELYAANKSNKDKVKNKFLANTKIRQALNLATNRKELVDQVTSGISTPATGLAPQGLAKTASGEDLAKYVAPGYKYDAKAAAKLFAEGLKEVGETKMTLTITSDADSSTAKTTLDYLQGSLQKALPGLKVEEKFVPFKQRLSDAQNQNFDAIVSLWGGDYPEGSTFYDLFKDGASYNDGQFKNTTYTTAVNKAETTDALNDAARDSDYKTAEAALYKEANFNHCTSVQDIHWLVQVLRALITNTTGLNIDFKYAYLITATFFLMQIMPGTPFNNPKLTPQMIAQLNKAYGLDLPLWQQYLHYLVNAFRGDFGTSFQYQNQSVSMLIGQRLPISAQLGAQALVVGVIVVCSWVPHQRVIKNNKIDGLLGVVSTLGISVPSFILGIIFLYLFGFKWPLFQYQAGETRFSNQYCQHWRWLFSPAAVVTRFVSI
ncbi:hypothetical protein Pfo_030899 [Paulownia fortunei]|nr:hypothetical protein Pfo_030899 [Paulownia fortunei]